MTVAELHGLSGAYALHALDAEERAAFARHLEDCAVCAEEVAGFRETAARLAAAVGVSAPPSMRQAVLASIGRVRQEPPAVHAPARSRPPTARRATHFLLAACLAAAAALGGVALWQSQRAQQAQQRAEEAGRRADAVAEVLGAEDAKARSARVGEQGSATVVVSSSRDRAVLVTSHLSRPERGRVYQLWFQDGERMRPAGFLDPARESDAVVLEGRVAAASGMGITSEPTGGSPQPTGAPLALMGLPGQSASS